MQRIKILTGFSGLGGSTIAHINLCNLLNSTEDEFECTLYGPHDWFLNKCKGDLIQNAKLLPDDIVIVHFLHQIKGKLPVKKTIISCHETDVMVLKQHIDPENFDGIHYVSQSQADFQGIPGFVIPNSVEKIKKSKMKTNCAGVIGSVDPNKQTHLSILRAKEEGFKKVRIYGNMTDHVYFLQHVFPLLSKDVMYCGACENKKVMYDSIDKVYHSSKNETYNLVKAECSLSDIEYDEQPEREQDIWSDDKILNHWRKIFDA